MAPEMPSPGERKIALKRGMPGQPPGPDGLLGVGVSFVPASDGVRHVVISVSEAGSAFASGKVFVGDVIISVNGVVTANMAVPEVVKLMKGAPGSEVALVLDHVGQEAFPTPAQQATMSKQLKKSETLVTDKPGHISPAATKVPAPEATKVPAPASQTPPAAADPVSPAAAETTELNGYHTKAWPDGKSYQGNFLKGMRHGKGVIKYPDGAMYDGEWKDDLRDGYGKYIYADGTSFQGEWKRGCRHGKGICVYSDGNTYEGDWVDSVPHGQGKCSFAQGGVYAGSFEQGKMHGFGTLRASDGSILFQGEWKDGETVQPPAPPAAAASAALPRAPGPQGSTDYTDPLVNKPQGAYIPPSAQSVPHSTSLGGKRCGVGLKLGKSSGGEVIVEKIQLGSAAGMDGTLQIGDVITSIDGVPISSIEQARELSQGVEGTTVRIEVSRGGMGRETAILQRRSLNSSDARASLRMSSSMPSSNISAGSRQMQTQNGRPRSGDDNCKVQ